MTNSKHARFAHAVGLRYEGGGEGGKADSAPTVEVKGDALDADEVVRIAERFGIPVVERPEIARALAELELDEEIPEELFEAVALTLNEIERRLKK